MPPEPPPLEQIIEQKLVACGLSSSGFTVTYQDELQSIEVVISDEVRATASLPAATLPAQEVTIRGRNEPMIVRTVAAAREISAMVNEEKVAAA